MKEPIPTEKQVLTIEGHGMTDGEWVRKGSVPRVAESLDDLRIGQTVAYFSGSGEWGLSTIDSLKSRDWLGVDWRPGVVILSDPPSVPVTVSREAFDRLAAIVGRDEPMKAAAHTAMVDAMWHDEFVDAARALVSEVQDDRR